ncbi:MAG: RNase adapter RapZ [Firmicutes bacterium]|nr:RNase adapter RapZ [Bacillota bacterium]
MNDIQFVLITGLSGAGKSCAVNCFEDLGYFCVDNLPPLLIPKFAEMCLQSEGKVNRVALVCDVRGRDFFTHLFESLAELEADGFRYKILFLESSSDVLVRRYKETRRRHPLKKSTILESIGKEVKILSEIRGKATSIIDTSFLTPNELRDRIISLYAENRREKSLQVTLVSFGYKHSIPSDCDLVFDVRFLPNPHYVEHLKPLTGNDTAVKDYVCKWPITRIFLQKLGEMLTFLIPHYVSEGKSHLIIGIGCTGGRHRSVTIANELFHFLQQEGCSLAIEHRDIDK